MFCPKCGKEMQGDICMNCSNEKVLENNVNLNKKSGKKFPIIAVVIIVVIALIVVSSWGSLTILSTWESVSLTDLPSVIRVIFLDNSAFNWVFLVEELPKEDKMAVLSLIKSLPLSPISGSSGNTSWFSLFY